MPFILSLVFHSFGMDEIGMQLSMDSGSFWKVCITILYTCRVFRFAKSTQIENDLLDALRPIQAFDEFYQVRL